MNATLPASTPQPFAVEHAFTETYRRYRHAPPALREAYCLSVQFPAVFLPLRTGDHFAGRMAYKTVGFTPQHHTGVVGYYCDEAAIRAQLETTSLTGADRQAIDDMVAFWRAEATTVKIRQAFPAQLTQALPSDRWTEEPGAAFPLYRMAGAMLDYDRLLQQGLPGLRANVAARLAAASSEDAASFYRALLILLDTLTNSARYLARQARLAVDQADAADDAEQFSRIADTLEALAVRAPASLHEAIQLVYLYTFHATLQCNYGRMDVYLGDFLAADLAAGRTTRDQALDDLCSFWQMMPSFEANLERVKFDLRVIVGGRGRRNPTAADAFALLAMDASDRVRGIVPQLSLRCTRDMNPIVYRRALDLIGSGATYPILYNDDVNIPALMQAFTIDEATAEQYVPFGCGEIVLDHHSFGTPNALINLPKALELALHDGCDPVTGERSGPATGAATGFATFEDVWQAYGRQVEYFTAAAAEFQDLAYRIVGEEAAFLGFSLLYDDCLERGKPLFSGGAAHLGGTYETYGNVTVSDSLTAIRHCVYERGLLTLAEVIGALDTDFTGAEALRKTLRAAPKFGNDDAVADGMALRVQQHVGSITRSQRERTRLDSFLMAAINNSAHILLGRLTAASADGRRAGEPLTNGYTATNGQEKNGLTALLNSMSKLDARLHAGITHNLKLARSLFTTHRAALDMLLKTYFECGGTQAMITTLHHDDLRAALDHPEQYAHLIVRVGGFSARFIDLPPDTQREIIQRTLWE